MSRMYSVIFENVAVTAAQDVFAIVAAAGKNLRVCSITLGQTTDVGDAAEEILRVRIRSGQTTVGSGGTAPTPVPLNVTDAAAGFTARVNDTTQASAGTIVTLMMDTWNIRTGYVWIPPEDMRIELTGGRRLTFELPAAPADSITCSGSMYVEEFG